MNMLQQYTVLECFVIEWVCSAGAGDGYPCLDIQYYDVMWNYAT